MNAFNKMLLAGIISLQGGCATSIKGKTLQNSLAAGAAGALYGNSRDTYQATHAAMYGGVLAAIAALTTVFVLDPDKDIESARKTTTKLRDELDDFDNSHRGYTNGRQLNGSAVSSFEKLPPEYRKMIDPGHWSISEIDQWVDGGEGRLIHQDKLLELKPATLKAR